jgi:DNA-binding PadR family transcriptional regulator
MEMKPSKLETYVNILEVLVTNPQKAEFIARKTHLKPDSLKRCLAFLVSNGVIEKRELMTSKQVVYALTERGMAVFKELRAIKYFEKLRESFPVIEEAREIASFLSKRSQELKDDRDLEV